MTLDPTDRELSWRRHEQYTSLYQFYLTGLVQINALQFAVTGGLLAYVLTNLSNSPAARWALLLPAVFASGQCAAILLGFRPLNRLVGELQATSRQLGFSHIPSLRPLRVFMVVFLVLNFATLVALGGVGLFADRLGLSTTRSVETNPLTAKSSSPTPLAPSTSR